MKETKFKDTEIGKIPEEWEIYPLSSIVSDMADGPFGSNLKTEHYISEKQVRVVQLSNIGDDGWHDSNTKYTSFTHASTLSRCIIPTGSVLIAKMMPAGRAIICPNIDSQYILGSDVVRITCNTKVEPKYFVYYTKSKLYLEQISDYTQGSTRQRTSISKLKTMQIVIPPAKEQHSIASALTSIDNLISSLGKLIEKKKNIKQGAMQQLLTGKTRLKGFTEPWVYRKISEIATTSSGGTPSRSIPNYYYGDIKWFTTTELKDNYLYDSVEHITREALNNSSAKMFSANTILMAMYGATIGKLGVLKEPSTTNQACCAIKCNDIVEIFLFYILLYNRKSIIEKGCGAGQPNISQAIVNELSFLVPPCEKEQQAIATILTKMDNEITALEAKRAKYEAIKQGMMQQLLTGKIRLIS
jgi:type I restriction enzyme S subunit